MNDLGIIFSFNLKIVSMFYFRKESRMNDNDNNVDDDNVNDAVDQATRCRVCTHTHTV
jgi:hypothetical protein